MGHLQASDRDANPNSLDFFRLLAIGSCVCSLVSVLMLTLSVPLLYSQMGTEYATIATKATKFKEDSNRIWDRLQQQTPPAAGVADHEQRGKRASGATCDCATLNCASGPPGSAGSAGPDGQPGTPGNPGTPGLDGLDILMESELDLPCTVCPGGPPGQRGNQGERGMTGPAGPTGVEGAVGKEGAPGPEGGRGPEGPAGAKGVPGHAGPHGDQVVAGIGIPGPKGMPGPAGMLGPPGLAGRRSMAMGKLGTMGEQGAPGDAGQPGRAGEAGEPGQSGEPGMPSMYCASDCGVSHIRVPGFASSEEPETTTAAAVANATSRQYGTAQHHLWGRPEVEMEAEETARKEEPEGKAEDAEGIEEAEDVRPPPRKKAPLRRRHPAGGYYNHRLTGGPSR